MKKLLIIAVILLPLTCFAQKPKFEIGVGYPFWMNKSGTDDVKDRLTVHFDGNFKLPFTRITAGFRVGYAQFKREEEWVNLKYQSLLGLATGSYSFSDSRIITPFVGVGAGIAFSNDRGGIFNDGYKTNFCLMPSVGVVIIRHICVSLDYSIISKKYSHAALRLGVGF